VPNSEKGSCCENSGYVTQNRALFVLDGAYGNGGNPRYQSTSSRSGLRHAGFDNEWLPVGGPITCPQCFDATGSCGTCRVSKYYPPDTVPSVSYGDLQNDGYQIVVSSFSDGTVRAFDHLANQIFAFNYSQDLGINNLFQAIESSEAALVDLNKDGVPEVIFNVYGVPTTPADMTTINNQQLYILSSTGTKLFNIPTNTASYIGTGNGNGNGCGGAAAPTVADINGDGQLEIITNTFDGRMIVWTVPGSSTNCLIWPTARGGYMRKGQPDYPYNG